MAKLKMGSGLDVASMRSKEQPGGIKKAGSGPDASQLKSKVEQNPNQGVGSWYRGEVKCPKC